MGLLDGEPVTAVSGATLQMTVTPLQNANAASSPRAAHTRPGARRLSRPRHHATAPASEMTASASCRRSSSADATAPWAKAAYRHATTSATASAPARRSSERIRGPQIPGSRRPRRHLSPPAAGAGLASWRDATTAGARADRLVLPSKMRREKAHTAASHEGGRGSFRPGRSQAFPPPPLGRPGAEIGAPRQAEREEPHLMSNAPQTQ